MAYDVPSFLKRSGDSLLFNEKNSELIYYVPESYFEHNIAITFGAYISFLGICDYTIRNITTGKDNGIKPFSFPTIFLCKPYAVEKAKNIKVGKLDPADYRLLKFRENDEVVSSVKVPQIIDNVESFFKLFLITGKIPDGIPYDTLQDYFKENINLNGSDYGITMQLFGVVISGICRNPRDLSKPFRLGDMKDMTDYKAASITTIPNYVSPYVSITSQNFDESLMSAITMKEDKYSPLEKVLTQ